MIRAKHINKLGHSPMAAARKHAKFLRDHLGMDFIAANAEVIEILQMTRDEALVEWDGKGTYVSAIGKTTHTRVHVAIDEQGLMHVQFSVPTAISSEQLHV